MPIRARGCLRSGKWCPMPQGVKALSVGSEASLAHPTAPTQQLSISAAGARLTAQAAADLSPQITPEYS